MPRIIDYPVVSQTLLAAGFESLYHNSGAFGFPRATPTHNIGWVGPPDPTLRPAAIPLTRQVAEPYASTMAGLAVRAWREVLPGPAWLMPRSHWAYELDFGNADWLPGMLTGIGVGPEALAGRNDGSAIEFSGVDAEALRAALEQLLTDLHGSDFALAFPPHPVACTIHHHKQVWWTTSDGGIYAALDALG